jgi:hypothetical protein
VFAAIPVQKQANKYFVYNREDWFRSEARPRAPGTESAGGGWRISTDTYYADRIALHQDVSDPERANADPAINLDADATEYITQQIMLRQEKDFVNSFFTTGVWDGASSSTDLTGQAVPLSTATNFRQWNDAASTPIEDLRGEITNVARLTGRKPNTLVMGPNVWTALADHPDILDRIKYTERGVVTTDLLAALLDLKNVYVMWAVEETGMEGSSSGITKAFVAGKSALLCYVEQAPGLRKPSAGYTFVWTGMTGTPAQGARIKRFRDEPRESDRVEGEKWYAQKVVSSNLGAFFTAAVA